MRWPRDFRRGRLYGVTQRGNNGQWIYIDKQDFLWGLTLMRKCAVRYAVLVHGWCLMHNHGHWIFEAADEESISNLMRDMQSQYSRYLNQRYRKRPWVLLGKLGTKKPRGFTRYLRAGPVNWAPRFDSEWLQGSAGLANFLRYIELNRAPRSAVTQRVRDPHQEVIGYAWIASERRSLATGSVEAS